MENSWKIGEDGEITKSKNKWYKSEDLKGFPKKAIYFSVENPKSVDQSKSPKKKKQEKEKEDWTRREFEPTSICYYFGFWIKFFSPWKSIHDYFEKVNYITFPISRSNIDKL